MKTVKWDNDKEDKVLVSLEKYKELREFEEQISSNNVYRIYYQGYNGEYNREFITINEAIKEIADVNERLNNEIRESRNIRDKIRNKFLKMSLWEFYKYRKLYKCCLLYTSPSPRDRQRSRMPSSA